MNPTQPNFANLKPVSAQPNFAALKPVAQTPTDHLNGFSVLDSLKNFATGVGKGIIGTAQGISKLGVQEAKLFGINQGQTLLNPQQEANAQPQGIAQNIGFGAEKLAEFLLPAAKAAQAEKAVSLLSEGISNPLFAAGARIAGKAAVQAVTAGGINLLQTGDTAQALKTAETAGITRGVMGVFGEAARASGLPTRLYQMIFKQSANDMLSELKSGGIQTLQKTDPAKFQEFVDKGIIKVGADGAPIINDTLAEKALNAGLSGSLKNMANETVRQTLEGENAARTIVQENADVALNAPKNLKPVMEDIAKEYMNVGDGSISETAQKVADSIVTPTQKIATPTASGFTHSVIEGQSQIDPKAALDARRLLDRLRVQYSYTNPVAKLSLSQQNLKYLSNEMRSSLNILPGMQDVMNKYSFAIDATQALAKKAAQSGNSQVISLIDSIFLAGGESTIPMGVLRRIGLSPFAVTHIAQSIQNANLGTLGSTILQAGSSGAASGMK